MRSYITHRLLVAGVIAGLWLWGTWWFSTPAETWYLVAAVMIVAGYTHYLVGGYYQLRSFARKANPVGWYSWFAGISIVSLVSIFVLFWLDLGPWLLVAVLVYFMVHGYYNERTLFAFQTKRQPDNWLIGSIALFLVALTLLGIGHMSWFYDVSLNFLSASHQNFGAYVTYYNETNPVVGVARQLGLIVLGIAAACYSYSLWRLRKEVFGRTHWLGYWLLGVGMFGLGAVALLWYPFHFVFAYSTLLLYHFIVWFLRFWQQFRVERPTELWRYIGLHLLVAAPFLLIFAPGTVGQWAATEMINVNNFLYFTMVHISTAFLSERWLQRWLALS